MLKIKKNKKGQFYIVCLSSNGRTLWNTESFTQKPAVWKNIFATFKIFGGENVTIKVIDESTIVPVEYLVDKRGKAKL